MKTSLSMSLDHKSFFIKFLIFFAIDTAVFSISVISSSYFLIGLIDDEKRNFFAFSNIIVHGFMTMVLMTFILLLHCFYIRFELINSCIKKNFATHEDDVDDFKKKKSLKVYQKLVLKLADLHDSLVDATVTLNHCFAFQMMNLVAIIFCGNIFATFSIYRVFVRNDFDNFYRGSDYVFAS
jgi:hypothetical protein